MKRIVLGLCALLLLSLCWVGCSDNKQTDAADSTKRSDQNTILTGVMPVIVDEAVLPIMQEQVEVFKSSYINTDIELIPLPEREAINALLAGKANIAVLARSLSEQESVGFSQRGIKPRAFPIFHDGVVFFSQASAVDTALDRSDVTALLKGESTDRTLVFDNINSSTFRLVKEYAGVDRVSGQSVKGMDNSKEVFEEVLSTSGSIGIVSYGQYLQFRKLFGDENKIRILSLQTQNEGVSAGYFKPSQTTFATDQYAVESSFQVLNFQPDLGPGIGFSAFLTGDRGQRIALKYGLLPATMPGREIIIREDNIN